MTGSARLAAFLLAVLLGAAWLATGWSAARTADEAILFLPYVPHGVPPGALPAPPTGLPLPTPSVTATPTPTPTSPLVPIPSATATATPTSIATSGPAPTLTATPLPPVVRLTAVADTFLTEGRADAVWGAYPGMFVGYDDQLWLRQRALIQFDLSTVPRDALVLAARLEVFIHNCYECRGVEITAHRATRAWDEATVTWQAYGAGMGESYGMAKLQPALVQTWVSVDVTELVRAWQRGTPNDGILLRGPEEPVSEQPLIYDFWGIEAREGLTKAPQLVIRWAPE